MSQWAEDGAGLGLEIDEAPLCQNGCSPPHPARTYPLTVLPEQGFSAMARAMSFPCHHGPPLTGGAVPNGWMAPQPSSTYPPLAGSQGLSAMPRAMSKPFQYGPLVIFGAPP